MTFFDVVPQTVEDTKVIVATGIAVFTLFQSGSWAFEFTKPALVVFTHDLESFFHFLKVVTEVTD